MSRFFKNFVEFVHHPVTIIIAGIMILTLALSYLLITVEKNAEARTQAQAPVTSDYRAYKDDDRINSSYTPQWETDTLIYNVTDGEDETRTPPGWVREWTPWGNPDIRCVMSNKNGGFSCFPFIHDFTIGDTQDVEERRRLMKTEIDGTREWSPMPRTMGDLYNLAKRWTDEYGTLKEIEIIENMGVLLISPKPTVTDKSPELENPPKP